MLLRVIEFRNIWENQIFLRKNERQEEVYVKNKKVGSELFGGKSWRDQNKRDMCKWYIHWEGPYVSVPHLWKVQSNYISRFDSLVLGNPPMAYLNFLCCGAKLWLFELLIIKSAFCLKLINCYHTNSLFIARFYS